MNLNNILEFKTRRWDFVLIESKSTDGSFILHHLFNEIIRANLSPSSTETNPTVTILITFSQTLGHYKGVQSKLGNLTHMNTALGNGQIIHIDLMQAISDNPELEFATVFNQAFEKVREKTANKRINLIIDDLSIPSLIGVDAKITLGFIRKLNSLGNLASMIVYVQLFDRWFVKDLVHMADLFVRIENLNTGYSKEIDGQVDKLRFNFSYLPLPYLN